MASRRRIIMAASARARSLRPPQAVVDVGRGGPLLRTPGSGNPARRAARAALQEHCRRAAATERSGPTTSGARPFGQRGNAADSLRRSAARVLRKCLCASLLRAPAMNEPTRLRVPRSHYAQLSASLAAGQPRALEIHRRSTAQLCKPARH